mmetsp:Transcript_9176/g.21034  ORF Transcript_9176/g.21034 Transcript_9176/m.21034 type:complete len:550 (+) Transcript_9176:167-1816(+)
MAGDLRRPGPAPRGRDRHNDAVPLEGPGDRRGGGEGVVGGGGSRGEEAAGDVHEAQRRHNPGAHHHLGDVDGGKHLRHDAVYEPGRPHPGQVRRAVERGLPHGRDALLRRAPSQEHRRHQRREGRPAHGPAHQHHGQHRGPPRLRPLHPRQGHAQGLRHPGQGELRRVRLGAPPNRHRRPRLGDHRPLRAGDDQGRAQPTGPEGTRDDEAARRGRGGPPDHVGGVRPGSGEGERILEDTGVRGRDRQHRGHRPGQERPRLLREGGARRRRLQAARGLLGRRGRGGGRGRRRRPRRDRRGGRRAGPPLLRRPPHRQVRGPVRPVPHGLAARKPHGGHHRRRGSHRELLLRAGDGRGMERPAGDEEEEGAHGRGRGRVRRDGGTRLAGGHCGGGRRRDLRRGRRGRFRLRRGLYRIDGGWDISDSGRRGPRGRRRGPRPRTRRGGGPQGVRHPLRLPLLLRRRDSPRGGLRHEPRLELRDRRGGREASVPGQGREAPGVLRGGGRDGGRRERHEGILQAEAVVGRVGGGGQRGRDQRRVPARVGGRRRGGR